MWWCNIINDLCFINIRHIANDITEASLYSVLAFYRFNSDFIIRSVWHVVAPLPFIHSDLHFHSVFRNTVILHIKQQFCRNRRTVAIISMLYCTGWCLYILNKHLRDNRCGITACIRCLNMNECIFIHWDGDEKSGWIFYRNPFCCLRI